MRNRIGPKIPWILGLVLILGLILYGMSPRSIEVDLGTVQRKRLEITVHDEGEMRVRERYIVSAPVAGEMQRVDLHPGDQVLEGETVLVRLVAAPPSLLDQRTIAELRAREGAAQSTVERSEELIQIAGESLGLAQHEFQRLEPLRNSKTISQAEFDAAEHQLEIARSNQRAAVFAKQIAAFELETTRVLLGNASKTQNEQIAEIKLVSPISGRVLSVLREDAGTVAAGTGILSIGDPTDLQVQIDVLSQDAVRIKPGARVTIERWGGKKPLEGSVRLVEPYAFLKVSALGVEEKRVRVIGDLIGDKSDSRGLGDGYRIEARIIVDETDTETMVIHSGALFRDNGGWRVFQMRQGIANECEVEIGATNGFETEILSGLNMEDPVILYPSDKIQHGVHVYSKK